MHAAGGTDVGAIFCRNPSRVFWGILYCIFAEPQGILGNRISNNSGPGFRAAGFPKGQNFWVLQVRMETCQNTFLRMT